MVLEVDSTNVLYDQTTMMQWVTMWPVSCKNKLTKFAVKIFFMILTFLLAAGSLGLFIKALVEKSLVTQSEAIYILTLTGTSTHRVLYYRRYHDEFFWLQQRSRALAKVCPKDWLLRTGIISQLYCLAGFISVILWVTGPLLEDLIIRRSVNDTKIPLGVYLPVQLSSSLFWIVYVLCCVCVIAATHIYISADSFLFTMIYVANGAIETLRKKLRKMHSLNLGEKSDTAHLYLKSCIKEHVFILTFLRKMDLCYRTMIVLDVLHWLISLTFAVLSLSESKTLMEWMKMIVFVGYCFFHQFCNCLFGQSLSDQQIKLFEDLHTVPWNEYDVSTRKTFNIMQSGMKNPIMLSAWRVIYLQYRTFLELSKNMMSYYMVLRQVLHKK